MSKKVLVMFGIRPLRPSILGHVDPQLMSDPEVRQFAYISERCLSGGFRPLPSRFWASTKNQLGDGWHLNWWPQSWRNSGIDQPVVVQAICSPLDFWKLKVCAGFKRWSDDPTNIDIKIIQYPLSELILLVISNTVNNMINHCISLLGFRLYNFMSWGCFTQWNILSPVSLVILSLQLYYSSLMMPNA